MAETSANKASLNLESSGFFVLRTPLLPIEELVAWSQELQASQTWSAGSSAAFEEAWKQDVSLLRLRLRELVDRPEIRQSLFVASPSLETSLKYWLEDPDSKKGLQAGRSLVRYFARMTGRPMPFGLFSGSSVGSIAEGVNSATQIHLRARDTYRGACRLDMDYVTSLTLSLRNDTRIARELNYWPNSSLRRVGSHWHYVELRVAGEKRTHHLVQVEADDYLDATIQRAEGGSNFNELVNTVIRRSSDGSISQEEAAEFVLDLIRNEVLISNLAPAITGSQPLDDVIEILGNVPPAADATKTLRCVRDQMVRLSDKRLGASISEYREIESALKFFPVSVDPARLFQVDLTKPVANAVLSQTVIDEIVRSGEIMVRVGQSGEMPALRQFRDAFLARYEHATVPLMEVLDDEVGIGFGPPTADTSPLLKGLALGGGNRSAEPDLRARLLQEIARGREFTKELNIDLTDLPPFENPRVPLPSALFLHVALVANNMEEVNAGKYKICFQGWAGPSGARLFGRFCHWDPQLNDLVKQHLRQEEATEPDVLFAEVVHLPEGRIGNVLCRPVLRDYEIVYLGKSGAPEGRQLPVSDLLVSLDPQNRIRLYSKRLGRRIVPRLTNAHGYFNQTLSPVYRFLCYLQHEDNAMPGFNWGNAESLDFLPRLSVGRTIISLARWLLRNDEIKKLTVEGGHHAFKAMRELRERRHIPRWILLTQGDQSLPFDFDNPLSVDAFLHVVKRSQEATIEEMYPGPEDLCVTGPEGHFLHELIIPFIYRKPVQKAQPPQPTAHVPRRHAMASDNENRALRLFPPGESWLYYKIYGGIATLDDLLTSLVPDLVREVFERQLASRWFFLRYTDPEHHLRIRFDARSETCMHELFSLSSRAFNSALRNGKLWKIQIDTYQREIEKYGGLAGMFLSENVFHADSDEVVQLLQILRGEEDLGMRWRLALLGIHNLFEDFGINLQDRKNMAKEWHDNFSREFGLSQSSKKRLAEKLRFESKRLKSMLNGSGSDSFVDLAKPSLQNRSLRLRALADQFRVLEKTEELQVKIEALVGSFAHMHINRLLRSSQRAHEMVIYDFLAELYERQAFTPKVTQTELIASA
jgi:thiopeptide-type bacteriocin biosynthesis protein